MTRIPLLPATLSALLWLTLPGVAAAQEDDVFNFIPEGGRSLLETLRESGLPTGLEAAIAEGAGAGDPATWRGRLDAAQAEAPALADLDNWQLDTLAHYLAANAPLDPAGDLPRDGRDMALQMCQSCHIITVVITQERTREAWLGTMHKPSHIEIAMTEAEREALADYLVLNAGIPIDLVPPALRAGGASY
ncbi:hypothetical protein [Actibacterium sp. MT2.3-13A]|uniref:hypothetical protein n=1 Tax=Actibacterium sp. MT2.3-13A TaxID=2828332 RepID=UPI001BA50270|nr:hypothetical protein [Actibacterium sp. MT2.3-13A]